MALVPIKTASETGYCDCVCDCYELANQRDEDTGKGYCPRCAKEHFDLNKGVGISNPSPSKVTPNTSGTRSPTPYAPEPADPPGRLR
ncbi:MAG TPA: hypothetical protein VOA41_09495 [Candidatus Dormibacteraeota bacterium]|nr:hypothetical protein [Candidatus Dormibacteraeota bacterium]